ncbi:NAD-dependent deacylase [Tropicibacter naphthalenivorans]|uniref:NAD-dependent protein deacylase n=1 Tax=Tropicibacter naphthalenivorans TaxID=441103 RepID=A0A0P1G9H5_9RHOB|nr:NAD-dependent deacylase [Tropicibacter naphthalenivorans]CUH78104.1 NAD-dependent protein deacylase [Tropicibacter naphthalenivorans]SMC93549.1 NAD-dependent deacetylase [Tropicibacter naphthalenivorans]
MDKIVILTGAGLSAESGLGTFRDEGGLWAQHRIEDVATPQGFARNPALVHGFYNARRAQSLQATPNAAHHALAKLQNSGKAEVILVTQNVDGLHEKAGSTAIHMHGQLDSALCAACTHRWPAPLEMDGSTLCPHCQTPNARPDIVWFGEIPYHMDEIADHLATCTLFASIGTSGQVYPAAGFVQEALYAGAETVELNLNATDISRAFHQHHIGPASQIVPDWVATLL